MQSSDQPFASKTLREHFLRGALGIAAFVAVPSAATVHPLLGLAFVPVAMLLLRGCPLCWTVGLVQTLVRSAKAKAQGRSIDTACRDGRCADCGTDR